MESGNARDDVSQGFTTTGWGKESYTAKTRNYRQRSDLDLPYGVARVLPFYFLPKVLVIHTNDTKLSGIAKFQLVHFCQRRSQPLAYKHLSSFSFFFSKV